MLWNRVAFSWGVPLHVFLEQHTSAQLTQLAAYLSIEPHGYEIDNWRAGIIASTVANVAPRKRGAKPLKPSDFYPPVGKGRTNLTAGELRARHAMRKRMKTKQKNG